MVTVWLQPKIWKTGYFHTEIPYLKTVRINQKMNLPTSLKWDLNHNYPFKNSNKRGTKPSEAKSSNQ